MADISKIEFPDGTLLNIKDTTARTGLENVDIDSRYVTSTKTVVLEVGSLGDADSTEY